MSAAQVRQLLELGDYKALRASWGAVFPHLPAPASDYEAEVSMHMARTQSQLVADAKRLYSHKWLLERDLPSQLPDKMRKRKVSAVGIAVKPTAEWLRPVADEVHAAMVAAVEDVYANGDEERPGLLKKRMAEARDDTRTRLLGRR